MVFFSHSSKTFVQMLILNCCVSAFMCSVGLFSAFEWLRCTTHVNLGYESGKSSFFLIEVQLSAVPRMVTACVIYRITGLCSGFPYLQCRIMNPLLVERERELLTRVKSQTRLIHPYVSFHASSRQKAP